VELHLPPELLRQIKERERRALISDDIFLLFLLLFFVSFLFLPSRGTHMLNQ